MEYYKNVRSRVSSSSSPHAFSSKRFFRSANLIREYKNNFQYFERHDNSFEHTKRNLKGSNVNSDIIQHNVNSNDNENVNHNNNNNLISYEHLSESWIDLVLPFTILAITILAVVFIAAILFIWIQKYFREKREKSQIIEEKIQQSKIYCAKKKCEKVSNNNNRSKMNSRKWLKEKSKQIANQIVNDDIEQKLETVEFKSTPPTSPNSQKINEQNDDEDDEEQQQLHEDDCEQIKISEIKTEKETSTATIIQCPLAISDISIASTIQPQILSSELSSQIQQVASSSSSLSLLQEEVHCVQPREEQSQKIYKSIATSPPPFSPIVAHHHALHHKYATTGTQTYFTKAPNSPNNLLSSSFAVLQTPTNASSGSFILSPSYDNKENKEPSSAKLRTVCLNKTINTFKNDNIEPLMGTSGGTSSSASSPSSVISTSPKVNTNVLQQQNSPKIVSVYTNTGSPQVTSATQKSGNFFRFPDIETTVATTTSPSLKASLEKQHSMTTNTSMDSMDVPITKAFENLNIENVITNDKESIILKIDEVESPANERSPSVFTDSSTGSNKDNNNLNNNNNNNSENTLTIRRARLKSISLDSDGARLVEENLTMPVEELVEIASYSNKQIKDLTEMESCSSAASCANNNNNNNNRFNPKNIYNLTINLDFRDSSLDMTGGGIDDINMNQDQQEYDETDDGICRTPTMKYFKQKKAVSLDSDNQEGGKIIAMQQFAGKTASTETFNYYFGQSSNKMNSSISVPSTPKHLTSNKLKISTNEERSTTSHSCGRYSRKLGSFEENADDNGHHHVTTTTSITTHTQQSYKSNLTASIQTLNISSSNLKTLPEIMSINDFDANQSLKPTTRIGPPTSIPPSKSGILQRRGSNHSLTLNLDGSCGNLARGLSCSNYSLGNIHSSHLNIAGSNYNLQNQPNHRVMTVKKNLLQRRGSNTSLTLNIQGSNNNLNRFNSHSSLNITGSSQKKGGLLERRNSNASLTLNIQNRGLSISNCNLRGSECSLSSVNTNQMAELMMLEQEAEHQEVENQGNECDKYSRQRKFLSSENLHSIRSNTMSINSGHRQQSQHQTPYGSIDNLKQTQPYHEKIPVISTKPLSPQSTSEDFKIYLANIQFLQSASNVLDEEHLETLNALFQKSYKSKETSTSQPIESSSTGQQLQHHQRQFNNDDILNNKYSTDGSIISFSGNSSNSPDEDQKQLLIKLHQEFWNLPTNYQEKPMVFGSQSKNRYKTILPNEHSRVILQKEEGAQQEPYINANFIKGPDYTSDCYIATQGPMQNTVYEFWLMVLQNIQKKKDCGVQKIAMLTDFIESQRQKCAVYFPIEQGKCEVFASTGLLKDESFIRDNLDKILESSTMENQEKLAEMPKISFNYFIIKNNGLKQKNGYSIRKLTLYYRNIQKEKLQQYTIYHYWFPDWPDHRSPQDIDVLLDMSLELLDGNCTDDFLEQDEKNLEVVSNVNAKECIFNSEKNPLPIIHCSAGIGRTGCLAAILNGLGQIRANSNGEGTSVDVLGIVCNLRLQRGGMVQNSEQYELIHRSLCLYQQKLKSKK
ncbi:hypothetical protein PVAND_005933 [Polypedilum vanderplanki]|uniref:protein-tyrosine-phosphatase n=1 Tax=Polypedilum vanderplanki TaxID=319348 RepID=A0A9J6C216_POLVA|nr:hypothetical protein PVAND_005933 [Polypedilum vanderplanki]